MGRDQRCLLGAKLDRVRGQVKGNTKVGGRGVGGSAPLIDSVKDSSEEKDRQTQAGALCTSWTHMNVEKRMRSPWRWKVLEAGCDPVHVSCCILVL